MKKYVITIQETISSDFIIEAESVQEALNRATIGYKEAKFVLEPGNVLEKRMVISDEDRMNQSDWIEI